MADESARVRTQVDLASESNFFAGYSGDIADGGVFIATRETLPKGTQLDLEIKLGDDQPALSVRAEVTWTREEHADAGPGMGLRFVGLPSSDRERIERFLVQREPLFFDDKTVTRVKPVRSIPTAAHLAALRKRPSHTWMIAAAVGALVLIVALVLLLR